MPKRTDISSILVIGNGALPSPRRGEGRGEGERALGRVGAGLGHKRARDTLIQLRPVRCARKPSYPSRSWEKAFGDQQSLPDFLKHASGVCQDVVVPEADHRVTVRFDQLRARRIGCAVSMLPAVQLDHQPRLPTGEVGDVRTDRELADELRTLDLPGTKMRPQPRLRFGRRAAQLARHRRQSLCNHWRITLTQPSPSRDRAIRGLPG